MGITLRTLRALSVLTAAGFAAGCGHVVTTPTPSPAVSPTPIVRASVAEDFTWGGARAGHVTRADTQCPDSIAQYIISDHVQGVGLAFRPALPPPALPPPPSYRFAPGSYDMSKQQLALHFDVAPGPTPLYLSVGGLLYVGADGTSGSFDVSLSPQQGAVPTPGPPALHLFGKWWC